MRFFLIWMLGLGLGYASSHHPEAFLKSIQARPDEGALIVKHFCATCHAKTPLIPLGAPAMHDRRAWSMRLKPGMKALLEHTENGMGAMPPRGGCFECTDKQLREAIEYMLPD